MNKKALLLVLPFLMISSSYGLAASDLVKRFSDAQLIQIMKEDGYGSVKKLKDGAIRIKVEGRSYVLFNKEDGDLQAFYAAGGLKLTFSDMNEWNKTRRLSRAYLDSDRDPVLEADLLANGGLTEKHVTEFFRVFKSSVEFYRKFILKRDRS